MGSKMMSRSAVRDLSLSPAPSLVIAATLLTLKAVVGGLLMLTLGIATIESSSSSLFVSMNSALGVGGTYV
jgi:hypothetical protein